MAAAMAKGKPPGLMLAFGMGKPGGDDPDESDHDAARDMLVSALHDVGIKGDEATSLVDALHEYVEACFRELEKEPHEEGPHTGTDEDEGEGY